MPSLFPRPLENKDHPIPPFDEALFAAAKNGDEKTLAARLKAGVPPDHMAGDMEGASPLTLALAGGHHGCMRLLLEAGADVHMIDRKVGFIPLRQAILKKDVEAVKLLLEFGADPGWECVRVAPDGTGIRPPVTDDVIAQDVGDPDIVEMVTAARKKFRLVELAHEKSPDIEEAKRLIAEGPPLDIKNNNGQTALMYACILRNAEMTKLLLEAGADTEVAWGGQTALRLAVGAHVKPPSIAVVKLLVEHGADLNHLGDRGRSIMHSAVAGGDEEIVKLLAARGYSLTAPDATGMTPLQAANEWSPDNGAEALLKKVGAWNLNEIGRQATELDKPVKAMKPISFGKK